MRRRPPSQNGGYNNQHRKQRYQGGGSGGGQGHHHNHGGNRHRKNYPAMREKYMNQAVAALSAGDRVMAEYFYQHADHCYRMMSEEGYFTRQRQPYQNGAQPADGAAPQEQNTAQSEEIPQNTSSLPAFLTANYEEQKPVDPNTIQNWEDRDAG